MNKKFALSTIGYAICLVIILGLVMIISAPMLLNNFNTEEKTTSKTSTNQVNLSDLNRLEEQINSRLDDFERSNKVTNKYICTIEGNLDEEGNVVSVDSESATRKFVFVCEYR